MSVVESGGIPISNLGQFGDEALKSPETVRSSEALAWSKTLGAPVEVSPLPEYVTTETISFLENLDFNLRFVPSLDGLPIHLLFGGTEEMPIPDYLRTPYLTAEQWMHNYHEFTQAVAQKYPKVPRQLLKMPKRDDIDEIDYYQFGEENNFVTLWRKLAQENAHWVALETTNRPVFKGETNNMQPYDQSIASKLIGIGSKRRDTFKNIQKRFVKEGHKILTPVFGVNDDKVTMRFLTPGEWMTLSLREGWYKTKKATAEWLQEEGVTDVGLYGPGMEIATATRVGNKLNYPVDQSMLLDFGDVARDRMGFRIAIDLPAV